MFILANKKYTRIVIEMEKMTHDLNLNLRKLKSLLHLSLLTIGHSEGAPCLFQVEGQEAELTCCHSE